MGFLIRYWYLIILAFLLSFGSAVGLLVLKRDSWMPPPKPEKEEVVDQMPGMSPEYSKWNYDVSAIEDIRVKLEAERESIRMERNELELLENRVRAEIEELTSLRQEVEDIREAINADYIAIGEAEMANIQQLAKVYTEMRPEASVAILSDLDIELVVKILSEMAEEPASRILAEMTTGGADSETAQMASRITELMQRVK